MRIIFHRCALCLYSIQYIFYYFAEKMSRGFVILALTFTKNQFIRPVFSAPYMSVMRFTLSADT